MRTSDIAPFPQAHSQMSPLNFSLSISAYVAHARVGKKSGPSKSANLFSVGLYPPVKIVCRIHLKSIAESESYATLAEPILVNDSIFFQMVRFLYDPCFFWARVRLHQPAPPARVGWVQTHHSNPPPHIHPLMQHPDHLEGFRAFPEIDHMPTGHGPAQPVCHIARAL